ncbi:MAG: thiamine phosphate synthase [Alphaproteobacteria bacterium]
MTAQAPPLYLILSSGMNAHNPLEFALTAAATGLIGHIQIRDKDIADDQTLAFARALRDGLNALDAANHLKLLLNDRVDLAVKLGASIIDGVHLGQGDGSPADARAQLGKDAVIGLTIKTPAHIDAADFPNLDYICIGGIFDTSSKINPDPPVGLDGLTAMVKQAKARCPEMPIGAIAGINQSNIGQIAGCAVDFAAIISALSGASSLDQVPSAAQALYREFMAGQSKE